MANSVVTATGDGVTVQYTLTFTLGILRRDYVTCRVGSEVDGVGDPVYRTLEWVSDSIVNIQGTVPADGESIVFTRTVPKNALIHDYSNGVPVEESNLDESNLQTIMSIHEFLDGRVEGGFLQDIQMNGYKILNVGDGVADTDAANMAQVNAVTTAAQAAVDSTAADVSTCTTKASEASTSAADAEDWASKTDGIVDATDYSSKAFAIGGTGVTDTAGRGAAKEWATKAEDSTVDGAEYSAKHYSAKASTSASDAAASAAGVSLPSITVTDTGAILQVSADGTTHQLLLPGTDGKFLKSNGPDALVSYEDIPNDAEWIQLSTQTASVDSEVDFDLPSGYTDYKVIARNLVSSTDASSHVMLVSTDDGSTFLNTGYDQQAQRITEGVQSVTDAGSSQSSFTVVKNAGNASTEIGTMDAFIIYDAGNASNYKALGSSAITLTSGDRTEIYQNWGYIRTTSAVDALRFDPQGNISGDFELWGRV